MGFLFDLDCDLGKILRSFSGTHLNIIFLMLAVLLLAAAFRSENVASPSSFAEDPPIIHVTPLVLPSGGSHPIERIDNIHLEAP